MSSELVYVSCKVNDKEHGQHVGPQEMLVDFLREHIGLTGTKLACDVGSCGACTVLVNGLPFASCNTFVWQVQGADVQTVEGLASNDILHPVQDAFIENSAFQCGYCTPGMILLAVSLLEKSPNPSREDIRNWMSANICRCTGYEMIIEAVEKAAKVLSRERQ